jgi:hypothetical protein
LQFPREGLEVTLPAAVDVVDLDLGTFGGKVVIEALDADGKVVDVQTVDHHNMFKSVTIKSPGGKITSLKFTMGGDEGDLASICLSLRVAK